jgi:NADP-dependent 3-hydroxy acid dehydrogenase YdfG
MVVSDAISVGLSGKTALVTGASSGIGAAVAKALAVNGAFVWINHPDEASAEAAQAVVRCIADVGGQALAIQADVSSEADVLAMFSQLESSPLDILVNNAGIAHSSSIETLEVDDFDRLLGVHLRGTFLCTRSALKIMYAQNSGRIIAVSLYRCPGFLPLHGGQGRDSILHAQSRARNRRPPDYGKLRCTRRDNDTDSGRCARRYS